MRVAVIGLGSAGRRHIGNLLALGCEVEIFDIDKSTMTRIAADYPAVARGGLDYQLAPALARREFDAVVVATPYDTHYLHVKDAVEYGVPFFCEKPLGSLQQLPLWRELAMATLPVNQIGYQCRFHVKIQALKHLFPAPFGGRFVTAANMSQWPGNGYGPMELELSHDLDLALWLSGLPAEAFEPNRASPNQTVFDAYADPGPWTVFLRGRYAHEYLRRWEVWDRHGSSIRWAFSSPEELGDQMYRDELAHFLECVRDGKPTLCPLSDGLRVLEVCARVMHEVPA